MSYIQYVNIFSFGNKNRELINGLIFFNWLCYLNKWQNEHKAAEWNKYQNKSAREHSTELPLAVLLGFSLFNITLAFLHHRFTQTMISHMNEPNYFSFCSWFLNKLILRELQYAHDTKYTRLLHSIPRYTGI